MNTPGPASESPSPQEKPPLSDSTQPHPRAWWVRWLGSGASSEAGHLGLLLLPIVGLLLAGIFGSSIYFARKAARAQRDNPSFFGLGPAEAASDSPTEVMFDLPDFSLTERSGRTVTLETLKGHVWIADFVFTTCAGPCPLMTRRMANLQSALAGDPDVRLLTITVDPKTDTPERLSDYARAHRAQPEKWLFLTGTRSDIYDLCRNGFKLAVNDEHEAVSADHMILHSTKFVLIDRQGRVRAYYDGLSENQLRQLEQDARKLAAERPS